MDFFGTMHMIRKSDLPLKDLGKCVAALQQLRRDICAYDPYITVSTTVNKLGMDFFL